MDNIMDQIPNEIRDKLREGGYIDRDSLPDNLRPMDRWDSVKARCGLSGSELSRVMYIICIPKTIHDKLALGGYIDFDHLPNHQNLDRWVLLRDDCGLNGGQLSLLMNILFPGGK
jgi:hypothetical protein